MQFHMSNISSSVIKKLGTHIGLIFIVFGIACGTYGAGERGVQGSGGETWGKETIVETKSEMGG